LLLWQQLPVEGNQLRGCDILFPYANYSIKAVNYGR
jgi:hypothetical protein